jgi:hypothetical protein
MNIKISSKEEALEFYDTMVWKQWSDDQLVEFQLTQRFMCIPIQVYMTALTNVLGREVERDELAHAGVLLNEYLNKSYNHT